MTQTQNQHAVEHTLKPTRLSRRFNLKTTIAALAVVGVTSALTAPAQAIQPPFQYSIDNVFPGGTSSYGRGINNSGRVAGYYYTPGAHAFYNGTDFNAALGNPVNGSYSEGLNDSGVTVGYLNDALDNSHSFIYTPASNTAQDLSSAFPIGTTYNYAYDINNSGTVVGGFYNGQTRAYRYSGGVVTDLTSSFPVGTTYSYADAINNSGKIVGEYDTPGSYHAFYLSNGVVTDLNPALGVNYAYAYDINNNNQVVGEADPNVGYNYAFLWSNGSATNIGNALPSGKTYSYAYGINDSGTVVGSFSSSNFIGSHAFVYANGAGYDLNTLIPVGSGWVLNSANAINNSGQITGYGTIGGQTRAFILSLHSISGSGTIGSGSKFASFSFNATGTPSAPNALGTFNFYSTPRRHQRADPNARRQRNHSDLHRTIRPWQKRSARHLRRRHRQRGSNLQHRALRRGQSHALFHAKRPAHRRKRLRLVTRSAAKNR